MFYTFEPQANTRLHPQGKGGPQAILCGQRLKTWTKNENTTTIRIQKSSVFERSAIYQSWTFWLKKCVFDRSRVADRRYVFAKLTDPLISTDRGCLDCATQKSCTGHFYTVTKLRKIRRRRRVTNGRTFLSVAHTKCPSGNYIASYELDSCPNLNSPSDSPTCSAVLILIHKSNSRPKFQ